MSEVIVRLAVGRDGKTGAIDAVGGPMALALLGLPEDYQPIGLESRAEINDWGCRVLEYLGTQGYSNLSLSIQRPGFYPCQVGRPLAGPQPAAA